MDIKKNIIIILLGVITLATLLIAMRSNMVTKMNKNKNEHILSSTQQYGLDLDDEKMNGIPIEKFLIVYDSSMSQLVDIKNNWQKVFQYIKKDVEIVDVAKDNPLNFHEAYEGIIIILDDLNKIDHLETLMTYTYQGGNLIFAYRVNPTDKFEEIYRRLGIQDYDDFNESTGIKLTKNVLINGENFVLEDESYMMNSSMSLTLDKESISYAKSTNNMELLWKRHYGAGNIMYFNGTMLDVKINRGLIVGILGSCIEDFIYPIMNTKISFIDDFPSPVPRGNDEKIMNEYNRDIARFYRDIWWPDMVSLSSKYNVKFTGAVIGTYKDQVKPGQDDGLDLNMKEYIYYGRELLAVDGELGIHGYNHQPLTTSELIDQQLGYRPWPNVDSMIWGLEEIYQLSKKTFPNYTFQVYVPPSNILSDEGRKSLLTAIPEIKVIASLYDVADEESYEQEYEIRSDGIIELPRMTSGYTFTDTKQWIVMNGITGYGIFSHFIHPDDVLDESRTGNKEWSSLIKEYEELNHWVLQKYPWLKADTASEGANAMVNYLKNKPRFERKEDVLKIYIDNYHENPYFILRSQKEIKSAKYAKVKKIDKDIYLIRCQEPISEIHFKR